MTSTPRSACSRTASRTPRSATPPRKWQCPPAEVIGGPAATIVGSAGAGLAQAEGEVVAVAEVAHRGDARAQLGGGGLRHRLQHGVVVARGEGGDRVEPRVEREVHVGVDQPGQERGLAEVDQLGVGRRGSGADLGDPPVLDEHERVDVGGDAVEEAGGAEGCTGHGERCTGVR